MIVIVRTASWLWLLSNHLYSSSVKLNLHCFDYFASGCYYYLAVSPTNYLYSLFLMNLFLTDSVWYLLSLLILLWLSFEKDISALIPFIVGYIWLGVTSYLEINSPLQLMFGGYFTLIRGFFAYFGEFWVSLDPYSYWIRNWFILLEASRFRCLPQSCFHNPPIDLLGSKTIVCLIFLRNFLNLHLYFLIQKLKILQLIFAFNSQLHPICLPHGLFSLPLLAVVLPS